MSSRRHLVSRSRNNQDSSPAERPRQRESEAVLQSTALPPYEPPSCPLSASGKRALDAIQDLHDYSKYKKHLATSIAVITTSIGDCNERVTVRKEHLQKAASKRRNQGVDDGERTEKEVEEEQFTIVMDKKVADLTAKAEKAMRDLVDYGDELAMKGTILKDVSENIAAAPVPRSAPRRQRRQGSDEGGDGENEVVDEEDEAPAANEEILSALELLQKAKQEYAAKYASKTMRARYDTNDYRHFKRVVHDGVHGSDGPPLPHARTWFPEDGEAGGNNARLGQEVDGEDDDEIEISGATVNMKCPLTLQVFQEPYSNTQCNHTFEKSAIIDYINQNGTAYVQPSQARHGPRSTQGPKQVKCPEVGCEAMLELQNFHDDQLLLRQIKRAKKHEARSLDDDDDEEAAPRRGTQRHQSEKLEDEDDSGVKKEQRNIPGVKREHQSRGPSMVPSHPIESSPEPGESEIEDMETS